jgi:hypothetical protein
MIIFVFFFCVCVRHRCYVLSFVNKNFIDRIGARDTHELDNFIGNQMSRHSFFSFSRSNQFNLYNINEYIKARKKIVNMFIKSSMYN